MSVRRYSLLFKRPPVDAGAESYADRYSRLRDQSAAARDRILQWLDDRSLADQVVRIDGRTAFNTLFVEATEEVFHALEQNPDVLAINRAPDHIGVSLLTGE